MPIDELTTEDVCHACVACGAIQRTSLAKLKASEEGAPLSAPDVIRLPQCECGAVEFLARSPAGAPPHPSPGSFGHLHRLLVDQLHAQLDGAVGVSAELKTWLPGGLRLSRPKVVEQAPAQGGVAQ